MTEAEWLASREWRPMIDHLQGRMGQRNSLLYVCASLREIWHLLYSGCSRQAVEVAEQHADGNATEDEVSYARWVAEVPTFGDDFNPAFLRRSSWHSFLDSDVGRLLEMGVYSEADIQGTERLGDPVFVAKLSSAAIIAERSLYIGEGGFGTYITDHIGPIPEWPGGWLVREVFGNPFRAVTFAPEWRTEDVIAIARKAYEDRAFDALPILADAVEEAGCDEVDLLGHFRGDGPHVLGCWALDLVIGKR